VLQIRAAGGEDEAKRKHEFEVAKHERQQAKLRVQRERELKESQEEEVAYD
jgi:hypothetical protein